MQIVSAAPTDGNNEAIQRSGLVTFPHQRHLVTGAHTGATGTETGQLEWKMAGLRPGLDGSQRSPYECSSFSSVCSCMVKPAGHRGNREFLLTGAAPFSVHVYVHNCTSVTHGCESELDTP